MVYTKMGVIKVKRIPVLKDTSSAETPIMKRSTLKFRAVSGILYCPELVQGRKNIVSAQNRKAGIPRADGKNKINH